MLSLFVIKFKLVLVEQGNSYAQTMMELNQIWCYWERLFLEDFTLFLQYLLMIKL